MEVIWVVTLTALIAFCLYIAVRKAYWAGYRAGATKVLSDWKDTIRMGEDIL
jgi:hypothetical protein